MPGLLELLQQGRSGWPEDVTRPVTANYGLLQQLQNQRASRLAAKLGHQDNVDPSAARLAARLNPQGPFADPQFWQDIGNRLMRSELISGAVNAFTAPHRAWTGELDPMSPGAVGEAMNVAGLAFLSGMPATVGAGPGLLGMNVFHGSPHRFDKFDLSKVGTGEGAQAYGHGLYFAENPNVARSYSTASPWRGAKAQELPAQAWDEMGAIMRKHGIPGDMPIGRDEVAAVVDILQRYGHKLSEPEKQVFLKWSSGKAPYLYKVDLPDEQIARMLDWDKPLSQQPESVRQAFAKAGFDFSDPQWTGGRGGEPTGEQIMRTLSLAGKGAAASQDLKALGIPGIRYLDQGSRAGGKGTYNFVVFDDSLPKIIGRE